MAKDNNIVHIDNSVIDASPLIGSRLNLNAKGSSLLAVQFIKFLRSGSDRFNQSRKGFRSLAIQRLTYTHKLPKLCSTALSYINNINENNNKFSFSSTSSCIVFSHLNKLCRSKAIGLDVISAKIISECANLISVSLCDLFNKSLLFGIFPDNWKCARVTPLFKQGEASDPNNCLPISVISVIAKVFERIRL